MNKDFKRKAKKGTMLRLLKHVYNLNKVKLILVLLFMILATLANVAAIYNVQNVVKVALEIDKNNPDFSEVIRIVVTMIILYLTNIFSSYIYLRLMVDVSQDSLVSIRTGLFVHMTKLPINYYDTNKHGDIMSRYTNDVDATRQMISQSMPQLIVSILTSIGYLVAMFITSYILGFITLAVTLLLVFITQTISKKSRVDFRNQQSSLGKMNGYIEEMIEGQKVIKVFRREKEAKEGFEIINKDLYENTVKATIKSGMLIPITVNVGYIAFTIVALTGAYLVSAGLLLIPGLVAYLLYTRNFTGPLNQIAQQANFIGLALAGASRIFDVFDTKEEENDGKVVLVSVKEEKGKLIEVSEKTNKWAFKKQNGDLIELKGDVRFNNVDFGYDANNLVLKNISLFAKPGQKIAFVGATGAGKTTITNLINRFYDINKGTITYDGIDIKEIDKRSLRKSLGMVLQDTSLFTTTVLENIRYGNLDATKEEVIEAAKLANAHDFIMKLPLKYETVLTDNGSNLSQGQRQLLSIARAAVNNPPVLILDEATSSIDTYTERLIQDGMDRLMNNRTVFVIAHRLSTIKNAKAIIVLEQGEIIERGNHNDLIDIKGRYYQLYTGLFELE